jgi:GNAT superfamily N-acetyltransferase
MMVDERLVRRLESGAAANDVAVVSRMCSRDEHCPADAQPFNDGALIAMGKGRYVNRAVGVTLPRLLPGDVSTIEAYFSDRGISPAIELSAWASEETVALLRKRGYRPDWFRAMYAMRLGAISSLPAPAFRIEPVGAEHLADWLGALAEANGITEASRRLISDEYALANGAVPDTIDLVALSNDRVIGCASLQMLDGVAWLGGAATIPAWRGRGVQTALIQHRLRLAAEAGVGIAAATAVPSGASARNLGRLGFSHVQTQVVVSTDPPVRTSFDR